MDAPQKVRSDEQPIRAAERAAYALRQLEAQLGALTDDLILAGEAWADLSVAVAPGADARPALLALVERLEAFESTVAAGREQRQASLLQLRHELLAAQGPTTLDVAAAKE